MERTEEIQIFHKGMVIGVPRVAVPPEHKQKSSRWLLLEDNTKEIILTVNKMAKCQLIKAREIVSDQFQVNSTEALTQLQNFTSLIKNSLECVEAECKTSEILAVKLQQFRETQLIEWQKMASDVLDHLNEVTESILRKHVEESKRIFRLRTSTIMRSIEAEMREQVEIDAQFSKSSQPLQAADLDETEHVFDAEFQADIGDIPEQTKSYSKETEISQSEKISSQDFPEIQPNSQHFIICIISPILLIGLTLVFYPNMDYFITLYEFAMGNVREIFTNFLSVIFS